MDMDIKKIAENLRMLRAEYLAKKISKQSFVTLASELYLELGLFRRADAVWGLIDRDTNCYINHRTNFSSTALNMIVKNEEKNILAALDSVDFAMDEIVICDTGSTDKTMEYALLFGVTLVEKKWNNNFSEARNFAIENSHSNQIFWMDADDRMEMGEVLKLQDYWRSNFDSALLIKIVNTQKNGLPFEFTQVRLFPNRKSIRFEQKIHEQVMYSLKKSDIKFNKADNITLVHTGYEDDDVHAHKALRNLKMIKSELNDSPENPSLIMSLGDCYSLLGMEIEAFKTYNKISKNRKYKAINPDIYVQAKINCANYLLKVNCNNYALPLLLDALKIDKTRTEVMLILGKIYRDAGNIVEAEKLLIQAAKTSVPTRLTATSTSRIKLEALYALVELMIENKDFTRSMIILDAAISDFPNVPAFYNLAGKIAILENKYVEAANYFSSSLLLQPNNNCEANSGLANIYSIIGDMQNSNKYKRRAAA